MSKVIKQSASLLVVAPSNEVLFMRRPSHGSYPSAHVFPGGVLEPDDPHLTYCALRETYEETGLLISPEGGSRPQLHSVGMETYEDALRANGTNPSHYDWTKPHSIGLTPMSQWITPPHNKKRFATQFYLYQAPHAFDLQHVKSSEVDKIEWLSPDEALSQFKSGNISMMPPQFYLMTALSEKGIQGAIRSLSERAFAPFLRKKHPDGRIELDWGEGEAGILSVDKASGQVTKIEYIRPRI
ncbi:hypothetical protein TRICI_006385 [Trichomonascus ciferrii]|uniref:Nudix hydrolase domain-containing protein n=1 Tax=Trichomonascus ciferrii TaxID=44093 RepID=A0A642UP95_9ASCO|nr:hypothetical protein TRICI_006385 [Trichomonascus ciferrii]